MKCFATVCVILLQVFTFLSLSSAQECENQQLKSDCCSSAIQCVFVTCDVNGKRTEKCYSPTDDIKCDDEADAVDTCGGDATTPATPDEEAKETSIAETVNCPDYAANRDECCKAGNSEACIFVTCSTEGGDVTGTACAAAGSTAECADPNSTPGNDSCDKATPAGGESTPTGGEETPTGGEETPTGGEETPTGGEETPTGGEETPGETTKASTGEEAMDCSGYSPDQDKCCAAGESNACIFVNCTSGEGKLTGTLCVASGTTPVCPDQNDTPSADMCEASGSPQTTPSEDQNPDQAPSSGGEDKGGQQFDAASFIGGIVLCAGILAIAYFGVKFYRSRQDKNYESM